MSDAYKVILFYRYVVIADTAQLQKQLQNQCAALNLLGRILIAEEGINGTLAGSEAEVNEFVAILSADPRFAAIDWKDSYGRGPLPFPILNVKIVNEIVSCGARGRDLQQHLHYDPTSFGGLKETGCHLTAEDFHAQLQAEPDAIVLDIRNQFEYDIGHFDKAINIGTFTYSETFDKLDSLLGIKDKSNVQEAPAVPQTEVVASDDVSDTCRLIEDPKSKKIFMYCTGGVRCEKASAYLRTKGFENVYQLQGGIHRYLQAFPDGGQFAGKNFVFDSRVAMTAPALETVLDDQPSSGSSSTGTTASSSSAATNNSNAIDPKAKLVVGQCLDCQAPYDQYSGDRVCTVCRQCVLVCAQCAHTNPHPHEYYCVRHRDLKGVYFTILERYNLAELRQQRDALQGLLDLSLRLAEEQKAFKLKQKQQQQRALKRHHKDMSTSDQSAVETQSINPIEASSNHAMELLNDSKHRRKTLRKQLDRLDERIAFLMQQPDHASSVVPDRCDQDRSDSHDREVEATVQNGEVLLNPKARVGYGFWIS